MNGVFGNVRNPYNRLNDFGYGFSATGDQSRIAQLQADLGTKNDELVTAQGNLTTAQTTKTNLNTQLTNARSYQYGKNQLCTWNNSQKTCDEKRQKYETETIQPLLTKIATQNSKISQYQTEVNSLNVEIANITQEIASLLEAQELEAQSTLTLAQQGKTPEQIKIEAQAQASAINRQAQQQAQAEERKSKSRKVIILSIIFAGLLIGGFWAFLKIRKKNK